MLLACVLRTPGQLDDVRTWLDPDDFTIPDRGACYQAALDLHDRGEPIDPVTLAWETRRQAPPQPTEEAGETTALDSERLMQLYGDGYPAQVAPYYGRQILESSIRTTTAQAARDLKTLAAQPSIPPADLLSAAAHRIDQVSHQESRWHGSRPTESRDSEQSAEQQADIGRTL